MHIFFFALAMAQMQHNINVVLFLNQIFRMTKLQAVFAMLPDSLLKKLPQGIAISNLTRLDAASSDVNSIFIAIKAKALDNTMKSVSTRFIENVLPIYNFSHEILVYSAIYLIAVSAFNFCYFNRQFSPLLLFKQKRLIRTQVSDDERKKPIVFALVQFTNRVVIYLPLFFAKPSVRICVDLNWVLALVSLTFFIVQIVGLQFTILYIYSFLNKVSVWDLQLGCMGILGTLETERTHPIRASMVKSVVCGAIGLAFNLFQRGRNLSPPVLDPVVSRGNSISASASASTSFHYRLNDMGTPGYTPVDDVFRIPASDVFRFPDNDNDY